MENVKFLGAKSSAYDFKNDKGVQVKGTSYKIFIGREIEEKDGVGLYPDTFKVDYDVYKDFIENVGYGSDIEISYEKAYDRYQNPKNILTGYNF